MTPDFLYITNKFHLSILRVGKTWHLALIFTESF